MNQLHGACAQLEHHDNFPIVSDLRLYCITGALPSYTITWTITWDDDAPTNPPPTQGSTDKSKQGPNLGGIIGGVVGGLAGVMVVVIVIIVMKKRKGDYGLHSLIRQHLSA